jgi:hypothetical protein
LTIDLPGLRGGGLRAAAAAAVGFVVLTLAAGVLAGLPVGLLGPFFAAGLPVGGDLRWAMSLPSGDRDLLGHTVRASSLGGGPVYRCCVPGNTGGWRGKRHSPGHYD